MSLLWLCLHMALAEESGAQWNADVKTFFVTVHPYEHILMPPTDTAQAFVDGRLLIGPYRTQSL